VWLARVALAVLLAGVGTTVALAGRTLATSDHRVGLSDAAAWLVSTGTGQATLVDGSTAQDITRITIGAGTGVGVQSGEDAFVTTDAGAVRRIDGATYAVSPPAPFGTKGQPLSVYPAGATLFVVNRATGSVTLADVTTLAQRRTFSLSARVPAGGAVAESASRLWVVDADTGDLIRVDAGGTKITSRRVDPARTTLLTIDNRPYAVDLAARRVWPIGTDGLTGSGACVDSPASDTTVQLAGANLAPQLYVTSGQRGLLLITDLATGHCDGEVNLNVPGDTLGQPVEAAGRVFVPDFTTGKVIIADPVTHSVVAQAQVLPANANRPFELRTEGSVVFYNDPASNVAGIIHLDGTTAAVDKYNPGAGPGAPTPTASSTPTSSGPIPGEYTTASMPTAGPSGQPRTSGPNPLAANPLQPTTRPALPAPPPNGTLTAVLSVRNDGGLKATADATASHPGPAPITGVRFDFGDGSAPVSAPSGTATHAYAQSGTYRVSVTVSDSRGATSTAMATVTVTAAVTPPSQPPAGAPAAPTNPVLVALDNSTVRLTWTEASTNVTGYTVAGENRSTLAYQTWGIGANTTSYTWQGLAPGTYVCMDVEAVNAVGASSPSAAACATTPGGGPAPAMPTNVNVTTPTTTSIKISWTDTTGDATGFQVTDGTDIYLQGANIRGFTLFNETPGSRVCLAVQAVNGSAASPWVGYVCATLPTTGGAPSAPTNGTVTATASSIEITWTNTATNATGNRVAARTQASGTTQTWTVPASQTSFTLTGLAPGTLICLTVQAYNAQASSATTGACAQIPTTDPNTQAPTNVKIAALSYSQVQLSWTAPPSNNETGFQVKSNSQTWDVPLGQTQYVVGGLAPGTDECLYVGAVYPTGTAWSNIVCVTTPQDTRIPATPSNVSATAVSPTSVQLTWTDSSDNVTNFAVTDGSRGNVDVPGSTRSYTWTGVTPGTRICLHVEAVNVPAGASSWSAWACATTPTGPGGPTTPPASPPPTTPPPTKPPTTQPAQTPTSTPTAGST
jgi:hypothetical protein